MFLLDEVFRKYKIFIDTSAFMYIGAQDVFTKLFPRYLSDYSTNVIVPIRVIEELKKYQRSLDKADVARKALSVISEYQKFNFVDIRGKESDSFTDNLFQTIFTKFRIKYNLCLITQDKRLAIDIYNLRKSKSVFTDKDILVLYISHNNVLKDWKEQLEHEVFKPSSEFNIPVKTNNIINISKIPTTDDTVLVGNDYNKVRLIKEIGKGGEGNIYLTDNNCCCKIYKKEKLTQEKYNKLILMLSKPLRKKGICWPKALVFNERK